MKENKLSVKWCKTHPLAQTHPLARMHPLAQTHPLAQGEVKMRKIVKVYDGDYPCPRCGSMKRKDIELENGTILQDLCANCGVALE